MEKDNLQNANFSNDQDKETKETPSQSSGINRRKFVEVAAASALAFTIVPRQCAGRKKLCRAQ